MDITTKFTIASEEGLKNFFFLRDARISGMYEEDIEEYRLNEYRENQHDHKEAVNELNNLTTQMVTVFVKNAAAGYFLLKHSVPPEPLKGKKVTFLESFYILPEYDKHEVRQTLWNKCTSITRAYDALWTEMLQEDPFLPYLKHQGFTIHAPAKMKPFDKASYILIRKTDS